MSITIGNRKIGDNNPCFLIAEIGTTCLGDVNNSIQLITACADAGVDAVKFQMIDPEQLSDSQVMYTYYSGGKEYSANMKDMFQQLYFNDHQWIQLKSECDRKGLEFFATVDYLEGVSRLEKLGVAVHKIGAWDITYKPLVVEIAKTGKPLFVDLGPATLEEVENLLTWFNQAGGKTVMFMHDYHTQDDNQFNMRAISYLNEHYDSYHGFSSPGRDSSMDIVALSLGASHIEKRLIMDRNQAAFHADESLEPNELSDWVKNIRHVERALGRKGIIPSDDDRKYSLEYYRSICTTRKIKAGEKLSSINLDGKRPGDGIPAARLDDFRGKLAVHDLEENVLIKESDIK